MINTILLVVILIIQLYIAYKVTDFKSEKENSELDDDELYEKAKQVVLENKKASTSLIQRKLGIGYSRSARLIDMMEEEGIISEADGTNPREVLIKK